MLSCLAEQIVQGVAIDKNDGDRHQARSNITIFLATDGAILRKKLAQCLLRAVQVKLSHSDKAIAFKGVEVDYFSEALPPAHFAVWTFKMKEMKQVSSFHNF